VRVRELLGREPQGHYSIAARDDAGEPTVLRNAPFLDDRTPMPTLFWLIGPDDVRRIGRLESSGGVNAAEAAVDPAELAAAHARYAAEREALIPADHTGPRPSGGVGGTRTGVKCLHAHWAWHLAGGDDPVGRWIASQLDDGVGVHIELAADATTVTLPNAAPARIPLGFASLTTAWLAGADPAHPADLTNALGALSDHLDDVEREYPEIDELTRRDRGVSFAGETITSLARLEVGRDRTPTIVTLGRAAAEDIFRLVATESAADRAHNPGLPSQHVETIVATCCVVLSVMRRFHLEQVDLLTGGLDAG
jgi:hypothetical protein